MTDSTLKEVNERPLLADTPLRTARMFHDAYERLAPQYGYETRQETRKWNPLSANGQLMQAVALEVLGPLWLEMERLRAQAQFISEGTTRWIPCAERKPDREGTYLIAHSGYVGTLVWDQGHGWQESYVDRTTVPSDYWNATITHWQPLPDSPK